MKHSLLVLCTLLMAFSSPVLAKEKELRSYVIVLFDFSNSHYRNERHSILRDSLSTLTASIVDKKNAPRRPVMTTVLPINEKSEASKKVCEFTILKKGLIRKPKETKNKKVNSEHFETYMTTLCANNVLGMPTAYETDIQGALSLAGQFGHTHPKAQKYLAIFSDMFEWRDSRIPVTKKNLKGYKILVVCSKDLNLEQSTNKPKLCMGQESRWRQVFSQLGASDTVFVREGSDWGQQVAKGLFSK